MHFKIYIVGGNAIRKGRTQDFRSIGSHRVIAVTILNAGCFLGESGSGFRDRLLRLMILDLESRSRREGQ